MLLWCARPAFCLVDINTASQAELQTLPGIGPVLSQRIADGRPYEGLDDLLRVKGIGPKMLSKFRDMIIAGDAATGESAPVRKAEKQERPVPQESPVPQGSQAPEDVPIYSLRNFKLLHCYRCKNKYKVSSDLKTGWCPYCGVHLAIW